MRHIAHTVALTLLLAACQNPMTHNTPTQTSHNTAASNEQLTATQLSDEWILVDHAARGNDNQPLRFKFDNGQVSLLNGCNNIWAPYQIEGKHLQVGTVMSTRMACEDKLMAVDALASQLLRGQIRVEHIRIEHVNDSLPAARTAIYIDTNGQTHRLIRRP